ncbi:MAG: very short patch repair endonuclease [Rhabdochlamydiaceae bacterium]
MPVLTSGCMDKFSKEVRSRIMSKIRSKDTQPELILRRLLYKRGYRYRVNYGPAHIDIAVPRKKVAIFVDGDFWHGYNWKKKGIVPKQGYWRNKISKNIKRRRRVKTQLKKLGWHVIEIWEHNIKKDPIKQATRIVKSLNNV